LSYISSESLSIYAKRLATNRGNAYLPPNGLLAQGAPRKGIFPNFDCKNLDFTATSQNPDEDPLLPGQTRPDVNGGKPPGVGFAPCFVMKPFKQFGKGRFPRVYAEP
jgi:hypothetical protein